MFFSEEFVGKNSWNGYERNCLFLNTGGGQFVDVARPTGSDCIGDSRGVAFADFDGDGRMEMAINNNNMPPVLYRNTLRRAGHWLELKLAGTTGNADAIGARVRLTAGGKTLLRQVEAGSGYAAQMMLPLHFGLGQAAQIEALEVTWPNQTVQRFAGAQLAGLVNQQWLLTEGATQFTKLKPGEQAPKQIMAHGAPPRGGVGL